MRFARFPHPSLQTLTRPAAPSPSMYYRAQNPRRQGFCDRPPSTDGHGGSVDVGGDSHHGNAREPNHGFRHRYNPHPPQQQYRRFPPPSNYGPPPPYYGPPPPQYGQPQSHFSLPPPGQHFYSALPPPFYHPPQAFRQPPQAYRQRPPTIRQNAPYKSADHREWNHATSQPPPQSEKFVVMSYNILADYLARDHRSQLYFHIPHNVLDWEWRKRRLLIEFGLWNPDIMCLQEVDKFNDLEEELAVRGYTGVWKMRTGHAIDGCAIFWRTNRFQLRYEEHIAFNKFGLRDNVAQICVLESRIQCPVENASSTLPASSDQPGANQVVVCNIHVLYNPKRGEIKLGQVRLLLDRASEVSRIWNDAPVVICGDFNSTPKSPLYNFISERKLSLAGLARDQVSGQYSSNSFAPRTHIASGLYSFKPSVEKSCQQTSSAEQRTICTISQTQSKSWDMENTSLPGNLPPPQSSAGVLVMSMQSSSNDPCTMGNDIISDAATNLKMGAGKPDVHCSASTSIQFSCSDKYLETAGRVSDATTNMKMGTGKSDVRCSASTSIQFACSDKSLETAESCNEQNRSLLILENINRLTPAVSSTSFEVAQEKHQVQGGANDMIYLNQVPSDEQCSLSDPNIFSQSTDKLNVNWLHQKTTEYSSKVDLPAKSNFFVNSESRNGNNHNNGNSDFEESSETSSSNMGPESVFAETRIGSEPIKDVAKEVSLIKIVSVSVPVNAEASVVQSRGHPSADLTIDQKDHFDISCENTHESKDLCPCSSTSLATNAVDTFINESDKVDIGDANANVDNGRINSLGDHPSRHNESREPNTEEGDQVSGVNSFQFEDSVSDDQGNCVANDLSSSEEISDISFFKELLGTDDSCQYREDVIPFSSSCQIQSPSATEYASLHKPNLDPSSIEVDLDSSHPAGSNAASQGRHPYIPHNPYLWTPMEIEIASGNAECTAMDHNLKLRSAYTDVEDYAGTKDSSREPQITSYNRQFMGTVDYIWCSEGVQTVKVLDTIPKHILRRTSGFPTQKWGSDHIALACELAFTKGFSNK